MDIEKLQDELMLAKVTHRFSFTRDEVMELIGVHNKTALELISLRQQLAEQTSSDAVIYISKKSMNWAKSDVANGIGQFSYGKSDEFTEPLFSTPPSVEVLVEALRGISEIVLHINIASNTMKEYEYNSIKSWHMQFIEIESIALRALNTYSNPITVKED